ncbi:trypsin-like serine peptidase [Achromobacter pestifer]|uniref:trypsin-like serine peptidase n=1 Tax=Achromobacter pestifer TaxID=1353889 RepID=UPI001583BA83|nr:serine protease [Achromobacter pestifer]
MTETALLFDSRTEAAMGNAPGVIWQTSLYSMGATNFLVAIKNLSASTGEFRLLVWNESGPRPGAVPEYVIDGNAMAAQEEFWIPLMRSSGAVLQLESLSSVRPELQFTYTYTAVKPVGETYSFRDPPRFVNIETVKSEALSQASRSVALLYWVENGSLRVCSGFMIGQRHLLSNYHCVATMSQCKSTRIIFGYRAEIADASNPTRWFPCKSVVKNDVLKERDLAVLELQIPANDNPPPGLEFASERLAPNQPLVIIQHPLGGPQQAVLNGCSNMRAPAKSPLNASLHDMAHQCDTADGSSGSPVLDTAGKVRAIHHWGYVSDDAEFKDLNRAILADAAVRQAIRALLP